RRPGGRLLEGDAPEAGDRPGAPPRAGGRLPRRAHRRPRPRGLANRARLRQGLARRGPDDLPDDPQPARGRRALRPDRRLPPPPPLLRLDPPAGLRAGLFGRGTLVRLAGDAAPWAPAARMLPFVRDVAVRDGSLAITLDDPDAQNPSLVQALVTAGAPVRYVE